MPDPVITPTIVGTILTSLNRFGGLPSGTRLDIGGRAAGRGLVPGPGQTIVTPGGIPPVTFVPPQPLGGIPTIVPPTVVPPIDAPPSAIPPPSPVPGRGLVPILIGGAGSSGGFPLGPSHPELGTAQREGLFREAGRSQLERLQKIERDAVRRGSRALTRANRVRMLELAASGALRILGGAALFLFPSRLGEGTLTEAQIREASILQPVTVTRKPLPAPRKAPTPLRRPRIELESIDPTPTRPQLAQPPAPRGQSGQRPATSGSSATSRRTGSSTTTRPGSPRTSINPFIVSGVNVLTSLLSRQRSARETATATASALSPSSLTNVNPIVLPFAVGPPAGVSSTRQKTCEDKCRNKKKRKTRKCLERGQIEWRTGRKKGKPAGSKCIRFAAEK